MKTDASLHVAEQRSFKFDEAYSAIVWNIPGVPEGSTINVSSVRSIQANEDGKTTGKWRSFEEAPFNPSWRELIVATGGTTQKMKGYLDSKTSLAQDDFVTRPKNRTYSFDSSNNSIYIFPKAVDSNTVYECSYTISGAAHVYDDVAELYWTYSSPVGDELARNIQMKIQLPVPKDADVLPYENVYAWGHGPEGSIEIRKDGVIDIDVPEVRSGQYSLAHVVFPRSWLRNVNMRSDVYSTGTRLGNALAEEEGWSDTDSAYEANAYLLAIILCVIGLVALIASAALYVGFGRENAPSKELSDSEKWIVSNEPAVCGRLLRWNHHSAYDLASVLQKLVDRGIVGVTLDDDPGKTRLRLSPSSKTRELNDVDQGAVYLIFETIGEGYQSVSVDDIEVFCKQNPELAVDAMREWQNSVTRQVDEAGVFDKKSKSASHFVFGVAAFVALLGVLACVANLLVWAVIATFAIAVACAAIAYNMPRRTQKGVDIAEALEEKEAFDPQNRPAWQEPFANAFGDALTA